MLATIPRAAPRAARRALTTGAAQRAPLAPPYEHSNRSSLAPPYAQHVAAASEAADSLQAPYAFQVVQQRPVAPVAPTPAEWVAGVLETEAGRQWAQTAWESALNDLAEQPTSSPEITFQALTAVLADQAMVQLFQRAGGVVVRDVVRDALAEAWAAELLAVRQARSQPTFHHEAQVAARSDPSVLSATGQLLRALVPTAPQGPAYVRVDAASSAPSNSSWVSSSLWEVDETASASTPINAHLALARTDLAVPTTSAAVIYALLRPHFTAKASRISFYSGGDYLARQNWAMRENGADYDAEHVHVQPSTVSLAPGDVLVSHAGLRLAATDASGLVLPVHPLPATSGNRAFVTLQRAAFEAGLPPPHINASGLIALESAGDASLIETYSGRRAMGYDA